ncbi:hypothetical protein FA13DRAFT_1734076 [Coprinellus micaceus]|uniref:CCHC-type domain-containing protein n=1 Tax=Coprinellus micaceus TaxID=71717 RepID=A0A4Y7T7U2_COPMI|nr:hypothetical protein FA13DRAFT_1734076 [Coprinellus micaceus]
MYAPEPEQPVDNKLLLPAHVTVFGSTPVEIIAPTTSLEDDSIQFLDYDDAKEFPRYYQTETQRAPTRIVCKKCNAENEHKTYDCPVIICLTCGVRDEHPTRSCPISKVCFNCGMKGHISSKCPNRHTRGIPSSRFMDCERCYSAHHKTNECPTWWRIYLYLSDEGKAKVLSFREERQNMPLGDGGEGYVAGDEWCYNCAQSGHWGDDCPDGRQPDEPSAFSFHNVASGPFYDPAKDGESSKKQRPRRTETFLDLERVPDDAKMMQDKAADDDQDDWFAKRGGSSRRASDKKAPPTGPRGKTFSFGQGFRDRRDLQQPAVGTNSRAPPSLLSRLSDKYNDNPNGAPPSSSKSSNKRKRERQRSPNRYDSRSGDRTDRWKDDRGDYRKDHRSGGGGGHDRHWEKSHSRREGHGGEGSGGGPRWRGSYNR